MSRSVPGFDPAQLPATIGFLDLRVEEIRGHLPMGFEFARSFDPLAEVSHWGIELQIELIAADKAIQYRPRRQTR